MDITKPNIVPQSHLIIDQRFKNDIEIIVLKEKRNVLIKDLHHLKLFFKGLFKLNRDVEIIEVDLYLDNERRDLVEQILRSIKDHFSHDYTIKQKYEHLYNQGIAHVHKDDIFFSIFEELTIQHNIILIIECFNYYAEYIINADYHRLYHLCEKKCKNRVSVILHMENYTLLKVKSPEMKKFLSTFNCDGIPFLSSIPSNNIIYKPFKDQPMNELDVYISYAWEDVSEEIVEGISNALNSNSIQYFLDKKDIGYKGNIHEFEDRLGRGNYIILVVSDKFLKSKDCMYEIFRIKENGDMHKRVFPIILESAQIYEPINMIEYLEYWEKKADELNQKLKTIHASNQGILREDIDNYITYRAIIADIISLFRTMNTLDWLTHKRNNYTELIGKIQEQHKIDSILNNASGKSNYENEKSDCTINQYGEKSIIIKNHNGDVYVK